MSRPCLAEEWFVADAMRDICGLCPMCRRSIDAELALFAPEPRAALSEIYRLSRAMRVKRIMAGQMEAASRTSDWAALETMRAISMMLGMAEGVFAVQRRMLTAEARP